MLELIPYTSLTEHIGARVELSYNEAMNLDSSEFRNLLFKHKILVFKNWQGLRPKQVLDLAQKLGTPWTYEQYKRIKEDARFDASGRAYTDYTNTSYSRLFSGIPWHVDIANEKEFPRYPARILYNIELPSNFRGMTTDVSNLAVAFDELSESDKSFYSDVYFVYQSWQKIGTNIKELPAIETHPITKEKFLRLNAVSQENGWIRSWYKINSDGTKQYLDNERLKTIIKETGDKYQYSHNWNVGDLIIFDNWATLHRKGEGEIFEGSTGNRRFVRISIDTQIDPEFNYGNTDTK